jgi:hypothetical protein
VARLAAALRPGETGCLFSGRFDGDVAISHRGRRDARIVLRAAPGEFARIDGVIDWKRGARYWRVTGLTIDGASSTEVTIEIHDDGIQLDHNDITNENRGATCIIDGSLQYGVSRNTVIDHNRIHDCGTPGSAPQHHHGVYECCGYGARVKNNLIYGNTGFGVQLYPEADGTVVANNVIDANMQGGGVFFGGDTYGSCHATDGAAVRNNIITNNGHYGINAWWGCTPGTHNVANRNCLWANTSGALNPEATGFKAARNLNANPAFVAQKRHDYRLRRRSRCAGMGPRGRIGP